MRIDQAWLANVGYDEYRGYTEAIFHLSFLLQVLEKVGD
jgi:hypothetical protein